MTAEIWLDWHGAIRDLIADGGQLVFVTEHPEGRDTAIVRLDPDKGTLEQATSVGATAICVHGAGYAIAGTDGHLHAGAFGKAKPIGDALDPAPVGVASIGRGLAALCGSEVVLLDAKGKATRFALPARGTAIASDPSGTWLVAGDADGNAVVLSSEEGEWTVLESGKIHDGAVTALVFEPDELRFRSAGADGRLKSTHARGALEPIDRTGRHGHSGTVAGIVLTDDRVYTAADQIHVWERGTRRRPAKVTEGVRPAVGLAAIEVDGKPHLALAANDDTIALFGLDESGAITGRTKRFHGALATARHRLKDRDAGTRKKAMDGLAATDDAASVELLASVASRADDRKDRIHAIGLLGRSKHPRAPTPLEGLIDDELDTVRTAVFEALRTLHGRTSLRPLEQALETDRTDIGVLAVQALGELAADDEAAATALREALDHDQERVRTQALTALEALHPDDATASLYALESGHGRTRWQALLRLFQRELHGDPAVDRVLRTRLDDGDSDVRQLAYHVRLLARPELAARLRYLDADLHRNLHDVQNAHQDKPGKAGKAKKVTADPADRSVLLQAIAARQSDTRLRGAAHLAAMGDPRALGLLLQLTRDRESEIQIRACRATVDLGDAKALSRLVAMLREGERPVRDAAFTAVDRLWSKEPLRAAEAGLSAPHADIRRRGLKVLAALLGKTKPRGADDPACELLLRALNDADADVRSDALKATLKLELLGSTASALEFAGQSLHTDVRREVLTERMAQIRHAWAWEQLLSTFDDPDASLRSEAFAFARKKGRGREPDAVVAALGSAWPDLRLAAIAVLRAKVDERAAELLIGALDDSARDVRTSAFDALQRSGQLEAIARAVESRHADVRIAAAASLAAAGDARAVGVLIEQVQSEEPEVSDLAELWAARVVSALEGLGDLRASEATDAVVKRLTDDREAIRNAAAKALAALAADTEVLRSNLRSSHTAVSSALALGLAWRGDAAGISLIKQATVSDLVAAEIALGNDEGLLASVDHDKAGPLALRALLLLSWAETGFPDRLVSALSAKNPAVRLAVAEVLEAWGDADARDGAVAARVTDRGGNPPVPVDRDTLRRIALAIHAGQGLDRVDAVRILDSWDVRARSSAELKDLAALIAHRLELADQRADGRISAIPDPGPPEPVDLSALVFGTYVGLGALPPSWRNTALRASAIRRLGRLEGIDAQTRIDALVPALSDDRGEIRLAAFEALQALEHPTEPLAADALATGHRDLGHAALRMLATDADQVLVEVMQTGEPSLSWVAYQLLSERVEPLELAMLALKARLPNTRGRAVDTLSERYSDEPRAADLLREQLKSGHRDVRTAAAVALGEHGDAAAFQTLVEMLGDADGFWDALEGLAGLNDPRVAGALVDRIEDDPRGDADVDELLDAVGATRDPAIVDRLIALIRTHEQHAGDALDALFQISGYDQTFSANLATPEADDEAWLEDQHPRRDDVLATVIRLRAERGEGRALRRVWRMAAWAKGDALTLVLQRLFHHTADDIRQAAVNAYGWRVRYRDASADPLVEMVGHAEPVTAFLAAEALALAKRDEGLSLLLASIDTLPDVRDRARAVLAAGQLGDLRALDPLLAILADDRHALIEPAAEAIGHLSACDEAPEIFDRLLTLSKGTPNIAIRALTGLRWFGSPRAFQRIREATHSSVWQVRAAAAGQLVHDDGPTRTESREALVRLVLEDTYYNSSHEARSALRRMDGPDSLEPDYVFLLSASGGYTEETMGRLRDRGDPARLVEVLGDPRCDERARDLLLLSLVKDPPVTEAAALLGSNTATAGALAARLLGRAAKVPAAVKKTLAEAVDDALQRWEDAVDDDAYAGLDGETERLRWTLWACAVHAVQTPVYQRVLEHAAPEASELETWAALAQTLHPDADLLGRAAVDGSPEVRALAASALVSADPQAATALVKDLVDDAVSIDRLVRTGDVSALAAGASGVHEQGVALPHLVRAGHLDSLAAALESEAELVRIGALEALGAVGSEAAEASLRAFATTDDHDEEERKVAWRALRRSKRAREATR